MKTTFTLRDFSIAPAELFDQKQILLVIRDSSELPDIFRNTSLIQAIDSIKTPDQKVYTIEYQYSGIDRLTILCINHELSLADQVADVARTLEGSLGIFVGPSLDCDEAIFGLALGKYRFQQYLTEPKELFSYELIQNSHLISTELLTKIQSIYLARDLVNMPPNDKNPQKLASIIQELPWKNTRVKILEATELERLGFGMLLAVAKGSDIPAYVIVFERYLVEGDAPECSIIGKGVTFDSGGLQIKPDKAMLDMKTDMAGAAATIATFWYLDQCNIKKTVVGAVGLVENLTGGSAFKPLDIVRAQNGLTVEIHHTDAEGRLVLGDLAAYISETYAPKTMVSIATLTGACMHALGYNYAGLMSEDTALVDRLKSAATCTHESVWQLPLDAFMMKGTHATIADRKNLTPDMMAGASMGAAFIAQFVKKPTKYAHLDIAGPSYRNKPRGIFPSEGTGFGTEILLEYVIS